MAEWLPALRRSATVSDCGRFRWRLGRHWTEDDAPYLCFVMLNPSIADGQVDDPTIRRCMGFARDHGFGGIEVVNLFAFRATRPADLKRNGFPVGDQCDYYIEQVAASAGAVCVAWGAHAAHPAVEARVQQVMPILARQYKQPQCLHITASGFPAHPLMLHRSCTLKPFTLDAIAEAMRTGQGLTR